MKHFLVSLLLCVLFLPAVNAQNIFVPNQKVEVNWKGRWYKATILQTVKNDYKIYYDGYAASYDEVVPASRIRPTGRDNTVAKSVLKYGKYGCTASKYVNGSYEYLPKGSFVLMPNGNYTYNGFEKPITGKYKTDASGVIAFSSGYFKGGEATPVEGWENRYYLVFPTIPDNRWTCSWMAEK